MGRTSSRVAAVAATLVVFGLLYVVISRNPWAPKRKAEPDPALVALAAKQQRLEQRAALVGKTVKRRWAVYERDLAARQRQIARVRARHDAALQAARTARARIAAVEAAAAARARAAQAAAAQSTSPAQSGTPVAVSATTSAPAPAATPAPAPTPAAAPAPTPAPAPAPAPAPPPPPVQVTSTPPVTSSSSSGTSH